MVLCAVLNEAVKENIIICLASNSPVVIHFPVRTLLHPLLSLFNFILFAFQFSLAAICFHFFLLSILVSCCDISHCFWRNQTTATWEIRGLSICQCQSWTNTPCCWDLEKNVWVLRDYISLARASPRKIPYGHFFFYPEGPKVPSFHISIGCSAGDVIFSLPQGVQFSVSLLCEILKGTFPLQLSLMSP